MEARQEAPAWNPISAEAEMRPRGPGARGPVDQLGLADLFSSMLIASQTQSQKKILTLASDLYMHGHTCAYV